MSGSVPPLGPKSPIAAGDTSSVEAPKPKLESPHPKVAQLHRVAEKLAPKTRPDHPGILAYVSEILGSDFLEYSPPEVKAFTWAAIRDARLGKWKLMRALAALVPKGNPFTKDAWLEAFENAGGHLLYEVPHLTADEVAAVRALIEGPIADFIRAAGGGAPRDLEALSSVLDDAGLRRELIARYRASNPGGDAEADVKAAIDVARFVIEQLHEHVDATVIDRDLLADLFDAHGQLDPAKVDALPAAVRVLLEDPTAGPRTIAAVQAGSAVSLQVLKKTPSHVIADLTQISASLAKGGFVWVDEYVRTGRRLQITRGDVERMKIQLAAMSAKAEQWIQARKEKVARSKSMNAGEKEALAAAWSIEDPAARSEALEALAGRSTGAARQEAIRFRQLYEKLGATRKIDPEAALRELEQGLAKFEEFRGEAVRVRVHGTGSASDAGLRGAVERSERLQAFGHRTLVETVSRDYASEATEGARKIIYGVAGLAVAGVGVHKLFGDGVMHTFISLVEDIMTDVGEIVSMTGQGIPLGDILRGPRFVGQLATLGVAAAAAWKAHSLLEAGMHGSNLAGMGGGLLLGFGSCALTMYTSAYSFLFFRDIGKALGREGKFDLADHRKLHSEVEKIDPEVLLAFDGAHARLKRIPTRADLESELRSRGHLDPTDAILERYEAVLRKHEHRGVIDAVRSSLPEIARRAAAASSEEPSRSLIAALEVAFDDVTRTFQGIPTGENLVRALAAKKDIDLSKAALETIRTSLDEAVRFVTSGVDPKAMLDEIGASLSAQFCRSLEAKGLPFDRTAVERAVRAQVAKLETAHLDSARIAGIVHACARDVASIAKAPELLDEVAPVHATLERHAKELDALLEGQLSPEMKKFAVRFGVDQVVANPIRKMLMLGILVCLGSLGLVGAVFPTFLLGGVGAAVLSFLASSESMVAAAGLAIQQRNHIKALQALADEMAKEARGDRLTSPEAFAPAVT